MGRCAETKGNCSQSKCISTDGGIEDNNACVVNTKSGRSRFVDMLNAVQHTNISVNSLMVVYRKGEQVDPTRTTTLRNAFVKQLQIRFSAIKQAIKETIVDQDVFGLDIKTTTYARATQYKPKPEIPGRRQFQFLTKQEKVQAFMDWLRKLEQKELLQIVTMPQIGKPRNEAWTDLYIRDSYKRGVIRARYELGKSKIVVPTIEATGGVDVSLSTPFHADRIGVLYTRTFEELKGITSQMDTQISRVLSQGMIDGDGPRLLARKLLSTVSGGGESLGIKDILGRFIPAERRAEIMARTEIIRAHHQATIQEYRNWGMEEVQVEAEFRTAEDARVCEKCAELHKKVFTLDEIEGMIPTHPQCRCIALPKVIEEKKIARNKPRKK